MICFNLIRSLYCVALHVLNRYHGGIKSYSLQSNDLAKKLLSIGPPFNPILVALSIELGHWKQRYRRHYKSNQRSEVNRIVVSNIFRE